MKSITCHSEFSAWVFIAWWITLQVNWGRKTEPHVCSTVNMSNAHWVLLLSKDLFATIWMCVYYLLGEQPKFKCHLNFLLVRPLLGAHEVSCGKVLAAGQLPHIIHVAVVKQILWTCVTKKKGNTTNLYTCNSIAYNHKIQQLYF
jgi:hypothetical protein